jgi:hypothetical protein
MVNSLSYMKEWGKPNSAERLKKIVYSIAAFHNNAVGRSRNADMTKACEDWLVDLDYLYQCYYLGRFSFKWPDKQGNKRS